MRKAKILYLDNDLSGLLNFSAWADKFEIMGSADLDEALKWLEVDKLKFDLIVFSTEVGGLTVYNLGKKLKSITDCPIILLSSHTNINSVIAINSGIDFICYKPIIRRDVPDIISFVKNEVTGD